MQSTGAVAGGGSAIRPHFRVRERLKISTRVAITEIGCSHATANVQCMSERYQGDAVARNRYKITSSMAVVVQGSSV